MGEGHADQVTQPGHYDPKGQGGDSGEQWFHIRVTLGHLGFAGVGPVGGGNITWVKLGNSEL